MAARTHSVISSPHDRNYAEKTSPATQPSRDDGQFHYAGEWTILLPDLDSAMNFGYLTFV
jgi:hypothetical protein